MTSPFYLSLVLFALASSKKSEIDKAELAKQIKNGNHKAFRIFFDAHYDSLLYFLMSKNATREVAEDLIQKAFIYIWEHRDDIEPEKSLRAYVFQIAYSRMLNHFRDHQKFNTEDAIPERETHLTPEDDARRKDLESAIDKAIQQMPERRGEVFTLCFLEQFTYRETAEALGLAKKTVENHMGKALSDIREHLEKFR